MAAHAAGLAVQLRAVRYAAAVAPLLNRTLVLPPFLCHCDRDPSGGQAHAGSLGGGSLGAPPLAGLLTNGCKLPSAESESYLPFACAAEDAMDARTWAEASGHVASGTSLAPSAAAVSAEEYEVPVPRTLTPAAFASSTALTRAMALTQGASQPRTLSLRMDWLALLAPAEATAGQDAAASFVLPAPLEASLRRGPAGGWCASCIYAAIPPALLPVGHVVPGAPCRFCLNFSQLLLWQPPPGGTGADPA